MAALARAVASSKAPPATVPDPQGACSGADLDLDRILRTRVCETDLTTVMTRPAIPIDALELSVEPAPATIPYHQAATFKLMLTNKTEAPLPLIIDERCGVEKSFPASIWLRGNRVDLVPTACRVTADYCDGRGASITLSRGGKATVTIHRDARQRTLNKNCKPVVVRDIAPGSYTLLVESPITAKTETPGIRMRRNVSVPLIVEGEVPKRP